MEKENEMKKEYLLKYRGHVRRINRIEAELSELRTMKLSISVNNDGCLMVLTRVICPDMLRSWIGWNIVCFRKGITEWWRIKRFPSRLKV